MTIELIDVSNWRRDDEHGIFPIGARDKKMLWSPQVDKADNIKPNWPYLFKLSRDAYPDQFWMETIAYIVGTGIGVAVPKALPAFRLLPDGTKEYGALLEWFYDKKSQHFAHASEFFHAINEEFDDHSGSHHNLEDLTLICRAMSINGHLPSNWNEWVCDMLLLDSLLGNSDRHQENWGIIFTILFDEKGKPTMDDDNKIKLIGSLSPYFDNGTSLGHERFTDKINGWSINTLDKYISKGSHHLRRNRSDTRSRLGHLESVRELAKSDRSAPLVQQRLNFDIDVLCGKIRALSEIDAEESSISADRICWVIRLLKRRHTILKLIMNMRTIDTIIEPSRLLLTWQPPGGGTRFVVGYLDRSKSETYTFTYDVGTDDFNAAVEKGFQGHPAFRFSTQHHTNNVLDPFIRRLPPRKRKDFVEYLTQHLLPENFSGSDFALLGYTGAKSPADNFTLIMDPSTFTGNGELILEVAGTRYQQDLDLSQVSVGDVVTFEYETENEVDQDAIAVIHKAGRLGYINKVHCRAVKAKLIANGMRAFVAKKNGTADRPLVYLFVECD